MQLTEEQYKNYGNLDLLMDSLVKYSKYQKSLNDDDLTVIKPFRKGSIYNPESPLLLFVKAVDVHRIDEYIASISTKINLYNFEYVIVERNFYTDEEETEDDSIDDESCENCGEYLDDYDSWSFCPYCGEEIEKYYGSTSDPISHEVHEFIFELRIV